MLGVERAAAEPEPGADAGAGADADVCRRSMQTRQQLPPCIHTAQRITNCGSPRQSRAAGSRLHLSLRQLGLTGQPPSPAARNARSMGRLPHAGPACWPSVAAPETLLIVDRHLCAVYSRACSLQYRQSMAKAPGVRHKKSYDEPWEAIRSCDRRGLAVMA